MPEQVLPFADFFDSAVPAELALAELEEALYPASALNTSLPGILSWQDAYAYAWARKGDLRFLLALSGSTVHLAVPPLPFTRESLEAAFTYLTRVNGPGPGASRVEGLTPSQAERARSWGFPARRTLTEYVYDRERVAGLRGDPYRGKRAAVNALLKARAVTFRPFRLSDLEACLALYDRWAKAKRGGYPEGDPARVMLSASRTAHWRLLTRGEDWGVSAWVAAVDGEVAAYTAGAPLSPATFGILCEIADLNVKGLAAYTFSTLAKRLEEYERLNAGDAEMLPALAQAKERWHPVERLEVFALDPPG